MQFVKDGPDVPNPLLIEHDRSRVVFFCGAGISYPAGLPGFGGLTHKLYSRLGETPNEVQRAALDYHQYDTAIGLLDGNSKRKRSAVREALSDELQPDYSRLNSKRTHHALLRLAQNRDKRSRLITTNFDRIFEDCLDEIGGARPELYKAPHFPVPKNDWSGLVYLHGLLPNSYSEPELDKLVISSGDFGCAYLTDRWASRFIAELFRNFTVCFVGYSIDDPMMRYIMDALAADKVRGETSPDAFAFAGYKTGQKEEVQAQWAAKNVVPILYDDHSDHVLLHDTLDTWASNHRDGIAGNETIVSQYAISDPLISTREDDYAGRLVWAISDSSGIPARRFAELDPKPSFDWLKVFEETRFGHQELYRFGVHASEEIDEKLEFSLLDRPSPYGLGAWMKIAARENQHHGSWDAPMTELANWLLRFLDEPQFFLWISDRGGDLHILFRALLQRKLQVAEGLHPVDRSLWSLLLQQKARNAAMNFEYYDWAEYVRKHGATLHAFAWLKQLMEPRIRFTKKIAFSGTQASERDGSSNLIDEVRAEISLGFDHPSTFLDQLSNLPNWQNEQEKFLTDATQLLAQASELLRTARNTEEREDLSYISRPSIAESSQNRPHEAFSLYVELVRNCWQRQAEVDAAIARLEVLSWRRFQYPIFRRLILFAATRRPDIISAEEVVSLLKDEGWWCLWNLSCRREICRFLHETGSSLTKRTRNLLIRAILDGPPVEYFREGISKSDLKLFSDQMKWLRLSKLELGGAELTKAAKAALTKIEARNPNWRLATDESDEFPFWMGDGHAERTVINLPRTADELKKRLLERTDRRAFESDDWEEVCRSEFELAVAALRDAGSEGNWPIERWQQALQIWSEKEQLATNWDSVSDLILELPPSSLRELLSSVAWWLHHLSEYFEEFSEKFVRVLHKCLSVIDEDETEPNQELLFKAINHPLGVVTGAIFQHWLRIGQKDGGGIAEPFASAFENFLGRDTPSLATLVEFGRRAIPIFRVDENWFQDNLKRYFSWEDERCATAAWTGYLSTARLYYPFLATVDADLFRCASHYSSFGECRKNIPIILTYSALNKTDELNQARLSEAIRQLPSDGLEEMLRTVARAQHDAEENAKAFWTNRALPFFTEVWPRGRWEDAANSSSLFAEIILESKEAFGEAVDFFLDYLETVEQSSTLFVRIGEKTLWRYDPGAFVDFLFAISPRMPSSWDARELGKLLENVEREKLSNDQISKLVQLEEIVRLYS